MGKGGRAALPPSSSLKEQSNARWLVRCEGFLVEAPAGRVGFVDEVLRTPSEQPQYLSIRAGRAGTIALLVRVENVEAVYPDEERIVLRRQRILEAV